MDDKVKTGERTLRPEQRMQSKRSHRQGTAATPRAVAAAAAEAATLHNKWLADASNEYNNGHKIKVNSLLAPLAPLLLSSLLFTLLY